MFPSNCINPLPNRARRNVLATALVCARTAIIRFFSTREATDIPTAHREAAMRWVIFFVVASAGGIAVVLLALLATNGFHDLGLDRAGVIALAAGITVTSALGVLLMALIFYSDRSGADEMASGQTSVVDSDRDERSGSQ
jgi:hypothetical protein